MRKALVFTIGLVLLLAAAGGGWYWWTEARFLETTDNAYVHSDISAISPEIEGYVRAVPVIDNQRVRAGDILVRIEDREYAARVAEAEALLAERRAALGSLDSEVALQHSLIAQAAAAVKRAEAELARAEQDYKRLESLRPDDYVSQQRFDEAKADRGMADAALAEAKAAHTAARDRIGVLEASRAELEAKVKQAEAALEVARADLDSTIVRAPVDGVVGNRGVRVGQYVRPGTQLMSVVPLLRVHVVANFKETQLAGMRPGQPVRLEIDAFPSTEITGTIESFAPASGSQFSLLPPENATGNFTKIVQRVPVRIAIPEDNPLAGLLRPGLSVTATLDTRAEGNGPDMAGGIFGAARASERTAPPVGESADAR